MYISFHSACKPSIAAITFSFLWSLTLQAQESASPQPPPKPENPASQTQADHVALDNNTDSDQDATPMMQGPLHEAFAEQFSDDPQPSDVVTKQPPEPINEQPPEFKPDGDDIQWIPGYWGWDIESQNFIWVSGIWRQVPPDQQWIPGYWAQVDDGWQWVSGFWSPTDSDEIAYLPAPPASIDNGPSEPSPDDNHFWIPGSWQYDQNQYQWQAGYWAPANQNWVWTPNRYVWTPSGYIYSPGYWDYAVLDRGTVFCPVIFPAGYQQVYQPTYCIELNPIWFANLFVSPGYNHYYYGNYYGYSGSSSIYPWVNYSQRTRAYDPLYNYYAYQGSNANWLRQLTRLGRQYQNAGAANQVRPTVAAYLRDQNSPNNANRIHVASIKAVAQQQDTNFNSPFSYKALDAKGAKELQASIDPLRRLTQDRAQLERANNDVDKRRTARVDVNANQSANADVDPLKRLKLQSNKLAGNISSAAAIRAENAEVSESTRQQANQDRSDRQREANPNSPRPNVDRDRPDNRGRDPRPGDVPKTDEPNPSDKRSGNPQIGNIQRDLENKTKTPDQPNRGRQPNDNAGEAANDKDNLPGNPKVGISDHKDPQTAPSDKPKNKPQPRNQNQFNQIHEGLNNQPLGQDEMKQLRDQMRGRSGNQGNANKGLQVAPGPSSPQRNDPRTMRPSLPKSPNGSGGAGGRGAGINPQNNPAGAAAPGSGISGNPKGSSGPGGAGGKPKNPAGAGGGGIPNGLGNPLGGLGGAANPAAPKGGGEKK